MTSSQIPPEERIPPGLRTAAGWTWRVLLLVGAGYLILRAAERLYLVVLPIIAAMLLTALGLPLLRLLRRLGVPAALSAGLVLLLGLGTVGGVGWWIVSLALAQSGEIATKLGDAIKQLPVRSETLISWRDTAVNALEKNSGGMSGVLTGLHIVTAAGAGIVLTLFITFYLLYDGRTVWSWVVGLLPRGRRATAKEAGALAWERLAGWVRGTVIIAVIHGIIVGVSLLILRVPLVAPLAVLVFLGSFIPIIGSFLFGGVAVLVTFAVQGWVAALVLVGILVIDNQLEAHVLQPFLVGRYVRLHPLVVVLAVTIGEVIEGLAGAILAVPLTAAAYAAFSYARGAASADILLPGESKPLAAGELPAHEHVPTEAAESDGQHEKRLWTPSEH